VAIVYRLDGLCVGFGATADCWNCSRIRFENFGREVKEIVLF